MFRQQEEYRLYIFKGNELLLDPAYKNQNNNVHSPSLKQEDYDDYFEIPDLLNEYRIRICSVKAEVEIPDTISTIPVRVLLSEAPFSDPAESHVLLRAFHVMQWRKKNKYCGQCGELNKLADTDFAMQCTKCGKLEFPRISPAIIVAITDPEDRLLLAHNSKFRAGMYSLIAGFVEAGETFEDTLRREVMEETGLELLEIRYAASQPWPFPDSIMVGFYAKSRGGMPVPDGEEILDAKWFSRSELPEIPAAGSLSRDLIDDWFYNRIKW